MAAGRGKEKGLTCLPDFIIRAEDGVPLQETSVKLSDNADVNTSVDGITVGINQRTRASVFLRRCCYHPFRLVDRWSPVTSRWLSAKSAVTSDDATILG